MAVGFAGKPLMHSTVEIAPRSSGNNMPTAPRPAHCRSRISNKPNRMVIDGRSRLGRRLNDLAASFARQVGGWAGMSDMMSSNVRRAAELTALAEQMRTEALRDGKVDPLALVRLEGAATRAVRALGLDRKISEPPPSGIEELVA